jgi:hypothetical protein
MSSNFINYSTLNSQHSWEIYVFIQDIDKCTFDNHNEVREGPIFNLIFVDVLS